VTEDFQMNRAVFVVVGVLWAVSAASAETAMGNSALALASLVAEQSPSLSLDDKSVMVQFIHANPNFAYLPSKKISVQADAVVCRQSNVDITERGCELTFGAKKVTIMGRKAHELFSTIREVGVPPDGAAGTSYESLSHLACSIDTEAVKQKAGGGADCEFQPGAN
jgi:hypothetical protein